MSRHASTFQCMRRKQESLVFDVLSYDGQHSLILQVQHLARDDTSVSKHCLHSRAMTNPMSDDHGSRRLATTPSGAIVPRSGYLSVVLFANSPAISIDTDTSNRSDSRSVVSRCRRELLKFNTNVYKFREAFLEKASRRWVFLQNSMLRMFLHVAKKRITRCY